MAGEVSKDITKRFLLPDDVVRAHEEGIIHFHDADYFAQHMHNCCLVNLEDMLQNGLTDLVKPLLYLHINRRAHLTNTHHLFVQL